MAELMARMAEIAVSRHETAQALVLDVRFPQPRLLLTNASGLTWAPDRRAPPGRPPLVLFSEMTGRGFQMAIASSTESRADRRTVYLPPGEPDMAHLSYLSPDGQQVLVVEMDSKGWLPCRLVPHDASSAGRPVGPAPAQCTDAAWSPDGRWMYFSTNTGNGTHIWRQRFPDGWRRWLGSRFLRGLGLGLAGLLLCSFRRAEELRERTFTHARAAPSH